jgi:hypothetical protein
VYPAFGRRREAPTKTPGVVRSLNQDVEFGLAFRPGPMSVPGAKGCRPVGCQPFLKMLFQFSGTWIEMTPVSSWTGWKAGREVEVTEDDKGVGESGGTEDVLLCDRTFDRTTVSTAARITPAKPISAAMICSDRLNLRRNPDRLSGSGWRLDGCSLSIAVCFCCHTAQPGFAWILGSCGGRLLELP